MGTMKFLCLRHDFVIDRFYFHRVYYIIYFHRIYHIIYFHRVYYIIFFMSRFRSYCPAFFLSAYSFFVISNLATLFTILLLCKYTEGLSVIYPRKRRSFVQSICTKITIIFLYYSLWSIKYNHLLLLIKNTLLVIV